MAIVSNPLIGKTKQSAGGITFTSWKGRNVMKNKATSVANPQTAPQTNQRNQFKGTVQFFKNQKMWLFLLMSKIAGNVTPSNKFVSLNIKNFLKTIPSIDLTRIAYMVFSVGDLGVFSLPTVIDVVANVAHLSVSYAPNVSKALPTDKVRFIVFNKDSSEWSTTDFMPTSGLHTYNVPCSGDPGQEVAFWVLSYSTTSKDESNTCYVGDATLS